MLQGRGLWQVQLSGEGNQADVRMGLAAITSVTVTAHGHVPQSSFKREPTNRREVFQGEAPSAWQLSIQLSHWSSQCGRRRSGTCVSVAVAGASLALAAALEAAAASASASIEACKASCSQPQKYAQKDRPSEVLICAMTQVILAGAEDQMCSVLFCLRIRDLNTALRPPLGLAMVKWWFAGY